MEGGFLLVELIVSTVTLTAEGVGAFSIMTEVAVGLLLATPCTFSFCSNSSPETTTTPLVEQGPSSVRSGFSPASVESIEALIDRDSLGSRVGMGGVATTGGVPAGLLMGAGEALRELLFMIPTASTLAGRVG